MQQIVEFLGGYQPYIWSVVLVVVGALVNRAMRLRPLLTYSVHHASNVLVDQPLLGQDGNQIAARQMIRTASIVVGNAGLQSAKNVEVSFNWKPAILNVIPARSYTDLISPFDRYTVKFDSFAPHEQVTIDIISINADLPGLTAVRCDDCQAKEISMAPQRVWPNSLLLILTAMMLLGMATTVFFIIISVSKIVE